MIAIIVWAVVMVLFGILLVAGAFLFGGEEEVKDNKQFILCVALLWPISIPVAIVLALIHFGGIGLAKFAKRNEE